MPRPTASRVIALWTRALLDEVAPGWKTASAASVPLTDSAALRGAAAYIPHEDMVALWSHHTDGHRDPLFGVHFAERHAERAVGVYAYAAAHAPDLGTAARACVQLTRLIDTEPDMTMHAVPGGVSFRHLPPSGIGRWPRHLAESLVAGFIHLGRTFSTTATIAPREVFFQHAKPAVDLDRWFGCAVAYEQPWNGFVFDDATLALPMKHADPTQFATMMDAATRAIAEVAPKDTFLDDVRAKLRTGGRRSLARLSRELGMSERTLQRRLGDAGVTFRQIVDEIRVEQLARQVKPQKGQATASALGFSDPSSVRRLRKRWRKPPR